MLPLRDLQRTFAAALTSGEAGAIIRFVDADAISAAERFGVYAGNRDAALINALRLTYPAVEALVGKPFFAAIAQDFAQRCPPASALLTLYGAGFAAFIEADARTAGLPYLADVARLEWAISEVAQRPNGFSKTSFALGEIEIALSASLMVLPLLHSAAAIWRAALDTDETALAQIALDPRPVSVAIWRVGSGANAAALSDAAAAFVEGLMTHGDIAVAVTDAAALADDPIAIISGEILQAGFVHLQPLAA